MPWIEQDPSGFYHVAFRFQGRRFRRSLKTRNRREAELLSARVEENIALVQRGRLRLHPNADPAQFLLADGVITSKPKRASQFVTLADLTAAYFATVGEDVLEASTLQGMRIHVDHLKRLLGSRTRLAPLSVGDLQRYIDKRKLKKTANGSPLSAATIKKELITFRTMWNWARNAGNLRRRFPGRGLKYPKLEAKLRFRTLAEVERILEREGVSPAYEAKLLESIFLTLEEVQLLLEHARLHAGPPFLYPMLAFAAHTGARRSEIMRSEIDDIDLRQKTITIRERKRVKGMKSTRIVPMSPLLEGVLSQWLAEHPGSMHTFCHAERRPRSRKARLSPMPLTADEAHDHFKRVLRGSRFEKLKGWHVLRHSFCSNAAAAGIDQRVINAWVGHQSEEMVERYRHLLPTQSENSIHRLFG
jgi:integrase